MLASSVLSLVRTFHDADDGAARKSGELTQMILECSPDPFSRRQFTPGHITCTGLVLAPDGESLLLIHHRRLDRWLLPGGHVEPEDVEIWDAARREVIEETGADLVADESPLLAGLDVHGIPAGKGEPYHLHHDILFHFRAATGRTQVSEESRAVTWCAPQDFDRYGIPDNTLRAYRRVRKLSSSR